jgi:hypothetical protein
MAAAGASAIDTKEILGFSGYLEHPVWDRKSAPLATKSSERCARDTSKSNWIYGQKGEMALIHATSIYDKKAGERMNYTTNKMEAEYWGARWSVDVFSGTFEEDKPWAWNRRVESPAWERATYSKTENEYRQVQVDWLTSVGIECMNVDAPGPLWISIVQEDGYDEGACSVRSMITSEESKWFLESKRPIFVVPLVYGGGRQVSHKQLFELSTQIDVHTVHQNPAATESEKKTATPAKAWVKPPRPADWKEPAAEWHISIFSDRDDYLDQEDEAASRTFTGTASNAVLDAFNLNAEKFPNTRILEVRVRARLHMIILIQARRNDMTAAMAAEAIPAAGELQMKQYYACLAADVKLYETMLAQTDPATKGFVMKMMAEHSIRSRYRRMCDIMENKCLVDQALAEVKDEKTRVYAIGLIRTPLVDPEADYPKVIAYIKNPAEFIKRKQQLDKETAELLASMGETGVDHKRKATIDCVLNNFMRNFDAM